MKTKVVHCRKDVYDVYIGRPTNWGNPFKVGVHGGRGECVRKFREWLRNGKKFNNPKATWVRRRWIHENVHRLKGKRLGCWCKPGECHGDVLRQLTEGKEL